MSIELLVDLAVSLVTRLVEIMGPKTGISAGEVRAAILIRMSQQDAELLEQEAKEKAFFSKPKP
jgi:hypothetical protein